MLGSFVGTLSTSDLLSFLPTNMGPMVTRHAGVIPAGEIPPQCPHIRFQQSIRRFLWVGLGHALDQSLPTKKSRYRRDKDKLRHTFFQIRPGGAALSPAEKGV